MLKYKQGDLIEAFENNEINVIVHQTNCTVGMGAGIAKKIANKYPFVDFIDKGLLKLNQKIVGTCYATTVGYKHIVNLYSQYYPGSPSNRALPVEKIDYDNFNQRIKWLRESLQMYVGEYYENKHVLGIPLIASGLAADKKLKGDMTDLEYFKKYIAPIVEEELNNLDVTVYYL